MGGPSDTNCDLTIDGRKFSDILKESIVPQAVQNILTSYPAFSYLKDSAIGIGLQLYSDIDDGTVAYAAFLPGFYTDGTGRLSYTLRVNTAWVQYDMANDPTGWRDQLESTIAHEFIHFFMDEALTAGMSGELPAPSEGGDLQRVSRFEDWFIEGMAQTAPGAAGWLWIYEDSSDEEITKEISDYPLGGMDSTSSYGTGYQACMYLGWVIAGGGDVTAQNISKGLNALLSEVIGGSSLDAAIKELTGGKFTSTEDFKTKFNNVGAEIVEFSRNLARATGSGRGGLLSGDLAARDLMADADLSGVKLFELNTTMSAVKNEYPGDYVILTGGTVSIGGVAPSDFKPAVTQKDYGDFVIKGNLPDDGSGGMQGIEWDEATKTLTVTTDRDIEITLKEDVLNSDGKIVLNGTGNVTLDGVRTASLNVNENTKVTYKGKNSIDAVTVDNGKNVVFQGEGYLKAGTFTNDGAVSFNGGAVMVATGKGNINGTVSIDKASVAATITSPKGSDGATELKSITVAWSKLTGLSDIASITFDGAKSTVPMGTSDRGTLWLDPASSHRITFTDSSGVSKTLAAKLNSTTNQLEWAEPIKPFTVTGGTEGTDYHYEDDGTTLVIDTNLVTSISGGSVKDEMGNDLLGRVKIKDGIGNVNLTLNGVDCSQNTAGSALDLGKGNNVTLKLADGTENNFNGKDNCAGIAVGKGTQLTIDDSVKNGDTTGTAGKLIAVGDGSSAAIGSNYDPALKSPTDAGNSITIKGGDITALGGGNAAGIGGAAGTAFGDIVVEGGTVVSQGGSGSAGIGGGNGGNNGNITIKGGIIDTAYGGDNAAGIGGGAGATCGNIVIEGGTIFSEGGSASAGIGSGSGGSSCGKIEIKGGTIEATGAQDSTGIGAGRNSTCGDITIGDPSNANSKVVVTAKGGMTNDGGNIMSYSDPAHTKPGTIKIIGNNTTVRAGSTGEGLYSTSGVQDANGNERYAYPVYLFEADGNTPELAAGVGLVDESGMPLLPLDKNKVKLETITISSSTGDSWTPGMNHEPLDNDYAFVWLKPENQTLTITYEEDDGTGNYVSKTVELELIYHPDAGVFRTAEQPDPPPAQKPGKAEKVV